MQKYTGCFIYKHNNQKQQQYGILSQYCAILYVSVQHLSRISTVDVNAAHVSTLA